MLNTNVILKPCPFCGGVAYKSYVVVCSECGATAQDVKKWNMRVSNSKRQKGVNNNDKP